MAADENSAFVRETSESYPVSLMLSGAEPSTDDQELFLKVLENLKNAVNKPDRLESHPVTTTTRSEPDEPGTTTVTVSDKTKSLILQKLASERSASSSEIINISHMKKGQVEASKQTIVTSALTSQNKTSMEQVAVPVSGTNVVLSYVSYDASARSKINNESVAKCSEIAPSRSGFHGNVPTQKKASVQLYPCNFCDYYSDNKNYLKQHVWFVHTTDRPYKCPYCDYAGKRSHALREHLIVHTDERPFQCKICNATFRKKGHLTNHVKLHNSKRLVKCPLCKVLVYDVGENGLDAHLKSDHDTERLFGCDLCDHVAANEPDILKHLSQKHKSKLVTHKCEKCPFETADSIDFQAHVRAHDMTESAVAIGSKAPTKVLGVATIPTNKLQSVLPNTTVRFSDQGKAEANKEHEKEVPNPQSAVIKPVWIKCSVCGFVEQDSEAIEAHMMEHLKDQYGEGYVEQMKSGPAKYAEPMVAMPMTPVRPTAQENISIQTPKAPILVPVSNVEQLLPQHAGKIDMNSPVLVPVTDPTLLKSLQSQTGLIATKISPLGSESTLTSAKASKLVEYGRVDSEFKSLKLVSQSTVPTTGISLSTQAVLKNTSVKVMFASQQGLPQSVPLGVTSLPLSIPSSSALPAPVSVVTSAPSKVLPVLTKIPVPRNISVTSTPKLPIEFVKLPTEVSETELEHVNKTGENEIEPSNEQKLASLKENLANVQKLIQEQEKISRQAGNPSVIKLDAQGMPEKINVNGVVYYIESTQKKNTSVAMKESFTHDVSAGRFKCTLCGYTCEYQRTIKAHIWKHSGNKNVDYPMFQNGPLSVYEDESLPLRPPAVESSVAPTARNIQMVHSVPMTEASGLSKLPSFIVYEKSKISNMAPALANFIAAKKTATTEVETDMTLPTSTGQGRISNVAPALANLIVARTMAGMTEEKSDETSQAEIKEDDYRDNSIDEGQLTIDESETCSDTSQLDQQSVVVEVVQSVANSDSFTAIQSQQNSPRVATRSPDSGLSEMTSIKSEDQASDVVSQTNLDLPVDSKTMMLRSARKRTQRSSSATDADTKTDKSVKKAKLEDSREDSAVTLLSLLKKGPNYNPACPTAVQSPPVPQYSNASSPGKEDSNSVGESDGSGKPKSGISTSLLAVIEQLRERSKSDVDEEKPPPPPPKKQYRRRSRKSSIEDNTPASGIENVEEFVKGGEVKYRCKLCHYTNDSTLLLRQHMKLHKPKQQFECSLCDLIAESSEALQDHMIQHCKVRTYQCKLCSSAFSYKSQLRAHMRMHNDQDILMCDYCDFETRNVTGYKLHVMSHASKQLHKCDTCNTEFESAQSLKIHKKEECQAGVDKSSSNGYACNECDFVSVGRRELKNHQKTHQGKAVTFPKKCPYCEFSDLTIEFIRKHISEVHGESTPLKCDMCGFYAVSIRSLKSHMKRHVNDQRFVAQPLEQYKCNLCGYVCHHLPSLKSHMWRHAADQHYSYEFTNDIINAAIDFDSMTDVTETTDVHVGKFRLLIYEKMKLKGLEHTCDTLERSAKACCWVTFRCCQCGFETINKAELNKHMSAHTDIIKKTLEVADGTESGHQSQDEAMSP